MIVYTLTNLQNGEEYRLTGKNDKAARKEAMKIILPIMFAENGSTEWQLDFWRSTDFCRGTILI